ncbi:MAG: OmpA family protein [Saprospiraceae bacterium]|nr:OmpA family protein [Saprospiraceae bacterium]
MRLILNLLVFFLVVGLTQSCVSKKKYDELVAAKEATDRALAETQEQVKQLQEEKDALAAEMESEKARLNGEIQNIKSQLDATKNEVANVKKELTATEKELEDLRMQIDGIFNKYKESGLSLENRDGQLFVVTKSPVNYNSGSYRVDSDERSAIAELAEKLKANPELTILVEGHTDDQKVKEGASYADNWELGYKRAMSIVNRLLKEGVNANQVSAVTRGDTQPVGDNDSADGRSENRRSVVKPHVELGNLIKN